MEPLMRDGLAAGMRVRGLLVVLVTLVLASGLAAAQGGGGGGGTDTPPPPPAPDPPGTPAAIETIPGPGASAVTVRWLPSDGATHYVVHAGGPSPVLVPANEDAVGWDGPWFTWIDRAWASPGLPLPPLGGGASKTYRVAAANEGGESNLTDPVAGEPHFACLPDTVVCVTLRIGEAAGAAVPSNLAPDDAPPVTLEMGVLRVEAAGEYATQRVVVARAPGLADPDALNQAAGPVALTYAALHPAGPGLRLVPAEDSMGVGVTVLRGRLLVYNEYEVVTDAPVALAAPRFCPPPAPYEPCENGGPGTPGFPALAALGALALVGAVARRRRAA